MTHLSSRPMKLILGIAVLALAVRITAGVMVGWDRLLPVADQPLYDAFAKNILEGKGFQIPDIIRKTPKGLLLNKDFEKMGYFGVVLPDRSTAFFPPVYPIMMTASYWLFGPHPGSARLVQSFFDALACFLVGWMGVRLFGLRHGVVAGLIYALYPAFIGLTTVLWTIGMGVFTLVLALALTVYFQQKPTMWAAMWMGMGWGLAALTRSALLPFLLVVLVLAWWHTRTALKTEKESRDSNIKSGIRPRHQWLYPLIIAIGMMVLLTPWGIRNAVVMGHFTLTPTKGGRNLWEANNGIFSEPYIKYSATAGGMAQVYHRYVQSRLEGLQRTDLIEFPEFSVDMSEFERDKILKRQVIDFLKANPRVATELCFLRFYSLIRVVLGGWSSYWFAKIAGIISMGFVLIGGLIGLVINCKRWNCLSLFYLLVIYYVAVHMATAAGIPHRLPLDAVLILFATSALFWGYECVLRPSLSQKIC